ncbi:MAG: four-carbon acid sugar kinase family protein [Hyphomicrobiaceae bacterium]
MLLGCIADDLTGATDLALMLARNGMRTVQVMGVPDDASRRAWAGFDAVVVALKSRTNPPAEAVGWSLESCDALLAAGARQIFFKYCSTFDSTDAGNIGPVAEALSEKLGAGVAVVNPAFPANKRSVYMGHLFVGDTLLSDSPMKDHPLTPMRDANLVRVLQRQTKLKVGLVPYAVVDAGDQAIRAAFSQAEASGERFVVVDAISDRHLVAIGHAAAGHKLITGGSGIAMGLPDNFVAAGLMQKTDGTRPMTAKPGRAAILAGSCSQATRGQVQAAIATGMPTLRLDPLALAMGRETADQICTWADTQAKGGGPVLVYSSDDPDSVARVQAELGRETAGLLVEKTLAAVAKGLVADGFTRMIVAGGETSGAVVGALGVTAIEIGPEIDPGVPWTKALDGSGLVLALKSGNFGAPDFFIKAWKMLA